MALSAIPGLGGPALELFNRLLAPPIRRRQEAWLDELAERLDKLEREHRLKLEDLSTNEEFISAVMQASTAAVRNHQEEKRKALRNAVLNTALGQSLDGSKRELFLSFVDLFTVWHLQILREIQKQDQSMMPEAKIETSVSRISELAQKLIPQLRQQPDLAEVVADDLCRRGMLFWNREGGGTYIARGTTQVTELGREFLRFISEPSQVSQTTSS